VAIAYIDESERSGAFGDRYLLGATIPFKDASRESHRDVMRDLLLSNKKKVHWYGSVAAHKRDIVSAISQLEVMHCVVTRDRTSGESSQRARSKCLELLAFELQDFEVDFAVFESRSTGLDRKDLSLLNFLRSSKTISSALKATHVPGKDEPMLWIADAICGAVGDSWEVDSSYRIALSDQLHVVSTNASESH
jgi:hypothetical protein